MCFLAKEEEEELKYKSKEKMEISESGMKKQGMKKKNSKERHNWLLYNLYVRKVVQIMIKQQ